MRISEGISKMAQVEQELIFGSPDEATEASIPDQGSWTEEAFLRAFPERGYELSKGFVEVLPMPARSHQRISGFLYRSLFNFVDPQNLGEVHFMGMRVRVGADQLREPDVVLLLHENDELQGEQFWLGADIAMEVVSPDEPNRDLKTKRNEYAEAGITEYWIADPRDRTVTVLTLPEGETEYAEAGRYGEGATAASVLLDGFAVNVSDVFSAK